MCDNLYARFLFFVAPDYLREDEITFCNQNCLLSFITCPLKIKSLGKLTWMYANTNI